MQTIKRIDALKAAKKALSNELNRIQDEINKEEKVKPFSVVFKSEVIDKLQKKISRFKSIDIVQLLGEYAAINSDKEIYDIEIDFFSMYQDGAVIFQAKQKP